VKRARFIAAARLEFLAEVIYYNDAQNRDWVNALRLQ
jgi:hypothetical protein